jgi:hypothetical protein
MTVSRLCPGHDGGYRGTLNTNSIVYTLTAMSMGTRVGGTVHIDGETENIMCDRISRDPLRTGGWGSPG